MKVTRSCYRSALVLLVTLLGSITLVYLSSHAAVEDCFVVISLRGEVQAKTSETITWREPYIGMKMIEGDQLKTGPDGYARLKREGRSDLLIRPNSTIEIGGEGSGFSISVLVGEMLAQVDKIASKLIRLFTFSVQTPTALAGVRGTIFMVSVEDDGTSRVDVWNGEVRVTAQGEMVDVPEGFYTVVCPEHKPEQPTEDRRHFRLRSQEEKMWMEEAMKREQKGKNPEAKEKPDYGHGPEWTSNGEHHDPWWL